MPSRISNSRVVWGGLVGLLGLTNVATWAEVRILEITLDGHTLKIPAAAGSNLAPVRISSLTRALTFRFTEDDLAAQPTTRLRCKLEGYDTGWRNLEDHLYPRIQVDFLDRINQSIYEATFPLTGETPGWKGAPETATFIKRKEHLAAPVRAASLRIVFMSQTKAIGVAAVDGLHVGIEHPDEGTREEFDIRVKGGDDLKSPMGAPLNWTRFGDKINIAQVRIRPTPTPHPMLVLNDDSANQTAAWTLSYKDQIPVRPNDHVTLEWESAHSIGWSGPDRAPYPALKPGHYWFRVAAARADGSLTGRETALSLVVTVPFYYRWEFWLVLATVVGGILAGLARLVARRQMRRKLAEYERLHALERERARIAHDLHDNIGAGLTEIAMQGDWVRRDLEQGPTADTQNRVKRICQSATELARTADEIVWAVNPTNDTLDCFVNYIVQSTEQFLDAAGLGIRFDIPRKLPHTMLTGKIRHYLFLAMREALHNVTKHAHAQTVRLEIHVENNRLQIVVADDGCGFVPEQTGAAGTHEGLDNMQQRMEEIGGEFKLTSRPGGGTRVEFLWPRVADGSNKETL